MELIGVPHRKGGDGARNGTKQMTGVVDGRAY